MAEEHQHAEAFMLMTYVSDDGTESERVWNTRDSVTPFVILLRSGKEATHKNWHADEYVPHYQPLPGERVFVDLTYSRALQHANLAHRKYAHQQYGPIPSVDELASSYMEQPGAPDLVEVKGDGTW